MRYSKPHLPFSAQIQLLYQRGLHIGDFAEAERFLEQNNYYRLSAYFYPFYASENTFETGAQFDAIKQLYRADSALRLWIHSQIESWEIYFKTQCTYWHAHKYGMDGYKDANHFHIGFWEDHPTWLQKNLGDFRKSKEEFAKHFKGKYHASPFPPLWMLSETMTFGAVSHFLKGMDTELLHKVANPFAISKDFLMAWVHTLVYMRNLCAHHGRLWNRKLAVLPPVPRDWVGAEFKTDRIFRVMSMLEYMNQKVHGTSLAPSVQSVLDQFPQHRLPSMGVPQNWEELWRRW